MANSFVSLAHQMGLHPVEAVALPAGVQSFAGKVGMTETQMLGELSVNAELRDYLVSVLRKPEVVAATVEALQ